jgi:hypothetical protein
MRNLAIQRVSSSAFQEEQNQAAFHEMPVFFLLGFVLSLLRLH